MRVRRDYARDPATGSYRKADIAQCPRCGSERFAVFAVEGRDHWHVQCARCARVDCPTGACKRQQVESTPALDQKRLIVPP